MKNFENFPFYNSDNTDDNDIFSQGGFGMDNDNLTDEEEVTALAEFYSQVMSQRNDEDYIVNPLQMDKLLKAAVFFDKEAKAGGGKLYPIMLSPKEEHGYLSAEFTVFHLSGEKTDEFLNILVNVSAFTVDTNLDNNVCISVTIPDVFVRKEAQ